MVNSAATPVTKTLIYCRPAKFCGKSRQMVNTAKQRRSLPMTISMTGFAAARGQGAGHSWAWDIRAVNGKVSLSLKVARDGLADGAEGMRVNPPALASVLAALKQVEDAAMAAGVTLGQPTGADVLAVRGVLDTSSAEIDTAPLRAAILADLPALLRDFNMMRAAEGAALHSVITGQLDRIATLAADAATEAQARRDAAATTLRDALTRVLANAEGVDETRLAQELALIAVKNDVTEELDRLSAHVDAARLLLAES